MLLVSTWWTARVNTAALAGTAPGGSRHWLPNDHCRPFLTLPLHCAQMYTCHSTALCTFYSWRHRIFRLFAASQSVHGGQFVGSQDSGSHVLTFGRSVGGACRGSGMGRKGSFAAPTSGEVGGAGRRQVEAGQCAYRLPGYTLFIKPCCTLKSAGNIRGDARPVYLFSGGPTQRCFGVGGQCGLLRYLLSTA